QAFVRLGDVVDEFHHVDGLADAGAAEQADLAALGERAHQVDDLDAGLKQLVGRGLLFVARRVAVDFPLGRRLDAAGLVDRATEDVHDAAQGALADRHRDALAGVVGHEVALQAVGRTERDGAHDAVAELLLHFKRDFGAFDLQCVVHLRHFAARELHVDDRADDLNDLALVAHHLSPLELAVFSVCGSGHGRDWSGPGHPAPPTCMYGSDRGCAADDPGCSCYTAAAPPTISEISCVIAACRALL